MAAKSNLDPNPILKKVMNRFWPILLSVAFLVFFYQKPLLSPGEYSFYSTGDGVKNAYTYLYHIVHDEHALHFKGMNYPHGEHIIYTDANVLLSTVLRPLYQQGLIEEGSLLSIYHSSIFISVLLGVLLLNAALRNYGIRPFLSGLAAIAVVSLSPQFERFTGHFTLSYLWYLPFTIWIVSKLDITPSRHFQHVLLWCAVTICVFFIHPYAGLLTSGILIMYIVFRMFSVFKAPPKFRTWLMSLALSVIPVIGFMSFMSLTDTVDGRSDHPQGFFHYYATPWSVFMDDTGFIHDQVNTLLEDNEDWKVTQLFEGKAYVGFGGILGVLMGMLCLLTGRISRLPKSIWLLLLVSVLSLLYSFGIPFLNSTKYHWILDSVPTLKQFRAIGRFAWPFYYVIGIFFFLLLHRLTLKRPKLQIASFLFFAGLYLWESYPMHKYVETRITDTPVHKLLGTPPMYLDDHDYQAILTLPAFFIGSEYLSREPSGDIAAASMVLSYRTGLPLMSSMLSRTSISQTIEQVELYAESVDTADHTLVPKDKRPFLVIADTTATEGHANRLLRNARSLGSFATKTLYSIPQEELIRSNRAQVLEGYLNMIGDSSLNSQPHWSLGIVQAEEGGFKDEDAIKGVRNKYVILGHIPEGELTSGESYEFSFWFKASPIGNPGMVFCAEMDAETGKEEWISMRGLQELERTKDGWHLLRVHFVPKSGGKMTFGTAPLWYSNVPITADRPMVRSERGPVYERDGRLLWYNNIPLELDAKERDRLDQP
jgi:hypothetical protein